MTLSQITGQAAGTVARFLCNSSGNPCEFRDEAIVS